MTWLTSVLGSIALFLTSLFGTSSTPAVSEQNTLQATTTEETNAPPALAPVAVQTHIDTVTDNLAIEDGYFSKFVLTVTTDAPIPTLFLRLHAVGITRFEVAPQVYEGQMLGTGDGGDDYKVTAILRARGKYNVTVITQTKQNIVFDTSASYDPVPVPISQ